jgi:hypothetical protein
MSSWLIASFQMPSHLRTERLYQKINGEEMRTGTPLLDVGKAVMIIQVR